MSATNWGIFKGVHNGQGIYWGGTYNVEGNGQYATMAQAKSAIDEQAAKWKAKEHADDLARIEAGAIRAVRQGETVTVHLKAGPLELTLRQYRNQVFDLEDQHGEIVLLGQ
jgi:hypothetical protein